MDLYSYWRSSASYRVRIALHLKQLDFTYQPVCLLPSHSEQKSPAYQQLNPSQLVPTLVDRDLVLSQSLAIIEYLDEQYQGISLIPKAGQARYLVKALSQELAIDIHPLNNLRVMEYLRAELDINNLDRQGWYHHWLKVGFDALEKKLAHRKGAFCMGDNVTMVDLCLIPQMYNARRFEFDLKHYSRLKEIEQACLELDAFQKALPERQPDANS